jgi:ATP-dependent Clp protease protease subunit
MFIINILNLINRKKVALSTMALTMLDTNDNTDKLIFRKDNNLYFSGSLTDESCFNLKINLQDMIENYKTDEINFYIQTNGGSVLSTFPVSDLIKNSSTPINTYVDGYCASAGTLLSIVGKNRYMSKHSLYLIHSLRMDPGYSNFNEIEDSYINAKTIMNKIKEIYNENSNLSDDELDYYFNHDIWIDAYKCLEHSIIDEII